MITSVFFSNENVQIVSGKCSGKKIVVCDYLTAPLPDNCIINGVITSDFALKKLLTSLWGKRSVKTSAASIVIDSSSILTKTLNLPSVKSSTMQKIIKGEFAEVENYESLLYDYFVLSPKNEGGGATVLSCAADRVFLQAYIEMFEAMKIKIESIDIAINCEIKLMNRISLMHDKTAIIAVLDKNTLVLSLFVNGMYRFISRSRLFEDRGTQGALDEISRAISSLIQFNSSEKSGYTISDIFFCGTNPDERFLCDELSAMFAPINAKLFPECPEVVFKLKKHSLVNKSPVVSDCLYSLGNLIRL